MHYLLAHDWLTSKSSIICLGQEATDGVAGMDNSKAVVLNFISNRLTYIYLLTLRCLTQTQLTESDYQVSAQCFWHQFWSRLGASADYRRCKKSIRNLILVQIAHGLVSLLSNWVFVVCRRRSTYLVESALAHIVSLAGRP